MRPFLAAVCLFVLQVPFCYGSGEPALPAPRDGAAKLSPELRVLMEKRSGDRVLVSVLARTGAAVVPVLDNCLPGRAVKDVQFFTGLADGEALSNLAAMRDVFSVISTGSFQPAVMDPEEAEQAPAVGRSSVAAAAAAAALKDNPLQADGNEPRLPGVADIHKVKDAWANGFEGDGVTVAVVDTGVDFGHPELQDTQARVASGKYAGWPYAYDTYSGYYYAANPNITIGPSTYDDYYNATWYCHTLPVTWASLVPGTCTGNLDLLIPDDLGSGTTVTKTFTWPDTSKSGNYRYTVHPDFNFMYAGNVLGLGYAASDAAPPAVLVVDEAVAGVYNTVYVDTDFDQSFADEKPMRKGDELAGADVRLPDGTAGTDGVWDLSAGMLTWISDGTNPPPGIDAVYGGTFAVPQSGGLVAFVGDSSNHGTNCASDIAAQGNTNDPFLVGPINPYVAGGLSGLPVLTGMAPNARIAAFERGFNLPYESWVLATLGFDGMEKTGDECHVISNSWGSSAVVNDGWDDSSRYAQYLNETAAPNSTFLVSTGNGGHGYGTATSPGSSTCISVGASTQYGTLTSFERVTLDQVTWGSVQPWSNRGPGAAGNCAPNVVAVGAWGTGANPLNYMMSQIGGAFPERTNGQAAYSSFGGTSMSCPVAAGITALVYDAYYAKNGRMPTYQEVNRLLANGCEDLGHDVLVQGSGNLNAYRSCALASQKGITVNPPQLYPGDFEGMNYPAFPALLYPGSQTLVDLEVVDYGAAKAPPFTAQALELIAVADDMLTMTMPAELPSSFGGPRWLYELTDRIDELDPDMVRVQVAYPMSVFDTNGNYAVDDRFMALMYDWTDRNHDGNLWTDDDFDGFVDSNEMDVETTSGVWEANRMTYGYPYGTVLEVTIGKDNISRCHDGIFFGLRRTTGAEASPMTIRFTYYKKSACEWLSINTSAPAPRTTSTLTLSVDIPTTYTPGVYQAGVYISDGVRTTVVPVIANVAANTSSFRFGAESTTEPVGLRPYDNGHMFGGFNWSWRYEAGDWRFYPFHVPPGTQTEGNYLVVDTAWKNMPTDIDTFILGRVDDVYSQNYPWFFGPYSLQVNGASVNTNTSLGVFRFQTATGTTREIVGAPVTDGLNIVALHNVLHAGADIGEAVKGSVYQMQVWPPSVQLNEFSGTWNQEVRATSRVDGGLTITQAGFSRPEYLADEQIQQDDPSDVCTASWVKSIDLSGCISLDVSTMSGVSGLDIDLYLFRDSTGDGVFTCSGDALVASSAGATADESVSVSNPVNGRYFIVVHGWSVPSSPALFDIQIDAMQGTEISFAGTAPSVLEADTTYTLPFTWNHPEPGDWNGVVFLGPGGVGNAIRVPVQLSINGPDLSVVKSASDTVTTFGGTLDYTVVVNNTGNTDATSATLVDTLSPKTAHVSSTPTQGSCAHAAGSVVCDLGTLAPDETATVTITVLAAGYGPATNMASVTADEEDLDDSDNTTSVTTTLVAYQMLEDDTFDTDDTQPPGSASGWSIMGVTAGDPTLSTCDYDPAPGAYRVRVLSNSTRFRLAGWYNNRLDWLPYSSVGTQNYVRAKYFMYAVPVPTPARFTDLRQIPNFEMRVASRFAVTANLQIYHHNYQDEASNFLYQELRPSTDPANPSVYRLDFDPIDVPYLQTSTSEGILSGFDTFTIDPHDHGILGMTERVLGIYPAAAIADGLESSLKVYAPSAIDAGNLRIYNSATDLRILNYVPPPAGSLAGTYCTTELAGALSTYAEGSFGVTLDSTSVPTDRIGFADRSFFAGASDGSPGYADRIRVAEGQQYKVRWHVTSTRNTDVQSWLWLQQRSIKYGSLQTLQMAGGHGSNGAGNQAVARQSLPGIGCLNPDQATPGEYGGWYTILYVTPMHTDVRPEFPAGTPLSVRMPNISAQPGPGVDASSVRDVKLAAQIYDTLSGGTGKDAEAANFTIDRIEVRAYDLVPD